MILIFALIHYILNFGKNFNSRWTWFIDLLCSFNWYEKERNIYNLIFYFQGLKSWSASIKKVTFFENIISSSYLPFIISLFWYIHVYIYACNLHNFISQVSLYKQTYNRWYMMNKYILYNIIYLLLVSFSLKPKANILLKIFIYIW